MNTLRNEEEAKSVIDSINTTTGSNPLGSYKEKIEHVGIVKFFKKINLKTFKDEGIEKTIIELEKNLDCRGQVLYNPHKIFLILRIYL